MRVGSLVFATDQGLGVLAKSFYDAGIVTDVQVVRHGKHPEHDEWYPDAKRVGNLRSPEAVREINRWAEEMDVMLFFETPFTWEVIDHCRSKGVKTVLMPMYECTPRELPARPDTYFCPSELDLKYFADSSLSYATAATGGAYRVFSPWVSRYGGDAYLTPVPVSVPWRQRTRAEVFVHNAGHGGLKGRNGTAEVVAAWRLVKSPAKLILRNQSAVEIDSEDKRLLMELTKTGKVDVRRGTVPYEDLWKDGGEGDVFLFPEKFNGLSLPLQEARAAGMLVMATDRFPMDLWLPTSVDVPAVRHIGDGGGYEVPAYREMNPLITPCAFRKNRVAERFLEFTEAVIAPKDVAAKVDEWYGQDVSAYSLGGKDWAYSMSWEVLGPLYRETLKRIVKGE